MKEVFKPIPIKEYSHYKISNYGRIINSQTNKELRPEKLKSGYLRVVLSNKHYRKRFLVHRLVALAFIPNPNNLPIINHKNEIKNDNRVTNIEWCTHSYNAKYNDLSKKKAIRCNPCQYLKDNRRKVGKYDLNMNLIKVYDSLIEAGRSIGTDGSIIWKCCNGHGYVKSVHGYIFKYL
jgi:hypothetical protein